MVVIIHLEMTLFLFYFSYCPCFVGPYHGTFYIFHVKLYIEYIVLYIIHVNLNENSNLAIL